MSGGPYGRGKAPERACLKTEQWPDADRQLWTAATRPSDLLDPDTGARSGCAPNTNAKAEKGYGRWLTFLTLTDGDALLLKPADRITPERVKAYVKSLQGLSNATGTILARLQELGEVARVLDPDRDWGFINRFSSRVRAAHRPARPKTHLKLTDELLDLGLNLVEQAKGNSGLDAAILHRDGLLIGLLSLLPLRRRNLADLRLGRNLIATKSGWLLVLAEQETKTHRQLELPFPDVLREAFDVYLARHRPYLAARSGRWAKPSGCALWISKDGSPMTEIALYDRVRLRTADAFGNPLNLHLFRDAAATTLAIADPEHVRIAAPLLGHSSFSTVEKYYQQATAISAHRQYIEAIFGRKENKE
jgi:integrase/recombinase XerD